MDNNSLRYEIKLQVVKENIDGTTKEIILKKFQALLNKIYDEEKMTVLYPYLSSSGADPIID